MFAFLPLIQYSEQPAKANYYFQVDNAAESWCGIWFRVSIIVHVKRSLDRITSSKTLV
jgi:hypothetical protein